MTRLSADVKRTSGDGSQPSAAGPLSAEELRKMDCLLAGLQLPVGRSDLPARQPAAQGAAQARARQAAPARPLGHDARPQLPLRPPQPGHSARRPEHDLRHRPRTRRPVAGRPGLAGGDLRRGLPEHRPGRGGDAAAVQAVLVPRRHPQPRRPGDARLDPRRRRTRLLPVPRLRRRLRQPRPDRRLHRRRRRGGNRSPGHGLARQQVLQPRPRRRRAAQCTACVRSAGRGASPRPVEQGVRRPVHEGQADHLRVPRLPVADPPADLPADEPQKPPRARVQGGRRRRRRRSTWWCGTTSTASTWWRT